MNGAGRRIPLEALAPDTPGVGGKAAGLARLVRLGLPVPPAFVLVDCVPDDLPPDLVEQAAALGSRLAVRSSALGEDGSDASFAGQYDTVLDVAPADVPDAVRTCLASLDNDRATVYRQSVAAAPSRMAVVVQRLVDARAAGVVFTADPVSGRRDRTVVDAVAGLGEALVSGHVTPDHALCAPDGRAVVQDLAGDTPVLTEAQRVELVTTARAAAERVGQPLDLEWALDKDDRLWWLQARPVTALPGDPCELDVAAPGGGGVYTRSNIGEMMPGAATPLSLSTTGRGIEVGMQRMYVRCGALDAPSDDWLFVGCTQGQLLLHLTGIGAQTAPILGASAKAAALAICGRDVAEVVEPPPAGLRRQVRATLGYGRMLRGGAAAIADLRALVVTLDIAGQTPEALYASLDAHLDRLFEAYALHLVSSSASGAIAAALTGILAEGGEPTAAHHAEVAAVLAGAEGVESADVVACTRAVVEALLASQDALARIQAPDEVALAFLHGDEGPVGRAWSHLLRTHGHRGYRELSMDSPAWQDAPASLLHALRAAASSGTLPNHPEAPPLPARFRRWPWRVLVGWAHQAVRNRETTKSLLTRATLPFKHGYRRLGELLAAQGRLPDAETLAYLTHAEIGRFLGGDQDLANRAAQRRTLHPRQDRLVLPDVSIGLPEAIVPKVAHGDSVVGKPVSHGLVTGRARVVRTLEEAEALRPGEVLVAPITDVGWTPYFSVIAALVTDLGSAVSHGAVVAREVGLPAVVNTRVGTSMFATGDLVEVDGSTGVVRRVTG